MSFYLKFAAALFLGSVPAWCDQVKEPPKPPPKKAATPAAKVPAPKGPAAKGAGAAKIPQKAMPPVFRPVPAAQIQRFFRLTPQERDIAIDKMPFPQQEPLRKRLAQWDAQPAQERERQLRIWDAVSKLPKDQQDLIKQRTDEWLKLPPERRQAIQRTYVLLNGKTEEQRRDILDSPEFKDRFTPAEQQIIVDLVKHYPNPPM